MFTLTVQFELFSSPGTDAWYVVFWVGFTVTEPVCCVEVAITALDDVTFVMVTSEALLAFHDRWTASPELIVVLSAERRTQDEPPPGGGGGAIFTVAVQFGLFWSLGTEA